ncbi:putative membrane protein [Bacteroides fragilis str. S23L17]|nr:putative membrane protein [Bacteroides fragilis str. S23L17]
MVDTQNGEEYRNICPLRLFFGELSVTHYVITVFFILPTCL